MLVLDWLCEVVKWHYRIQANKIKKKTISINPQKTIYFSIDDTIEIFKDLTDNAEKYTTIFDNSMLAYLKELHNFYNIKICLFCFYENEAGFNLQMTTNKFIDEFKHNAYWLKFGFHGRNYQLTYDKTNALTAERDYTNIIHEIKRICGPEVITRVVRLSSFQGNRTSLLSMRDCEYGIKGLFTADDERESYYCTSRGWRQGCEIDGIKYFHTDIRIENDNYRKYKQFMKERNCVVFTHEYYLMCKKTQLRMEKLCLDFLREGFVFSFGDNFLNFHDI